MENFDPKPEKRRERAELSFGRAGHELEYIFVLDSSDIPSEISTSLEVALGEDWEVLDRGTRIEIRNKKKLGLRDDEKIKTAIEKSVGDQYNLRVFL